MNSNRRSIVRSFSKLCSAIKHNFEIPVHNYVVRNEHIVLLMIMKLLMPLCNRIESTNSKAIS